MWSESLVSHKDQALVAHTFNPSTGRQRQTDLCEFKATLDYTRLSQSQGKRSPAVAAHVFNPTTREVERGSDMAGQREENKAGGDKKSRHSV